LQWNQSLIYSATAAYFASRLAGAPIMSQGRGDVASLEYKEIFALQKLLVARGFDVGEKIDGIIGAQTREAVRQVQMELGLPADGYPDQNLLAKLRR
jgi:peptidoglycan hydrolase-like protein with peptidoglycan-binding domain